MDVEEIKEKQTKVRRGYLSKMDDAFTSAHIKAGRKILQGL